MAADKVTDENTGYINQYQENITKTLTTEKKHEYTNKLERNKRKPRKNDTWH